MERLGHDERLGRNLYVLEVDRAEDLALHLRAPPGRFVALVLWDAAGATNDDISRVVQVLVAAGCVYLCTWGKECGRVHDVADETRVMATLNDSDAPTLMTTWHDDCSLDETLAFFLTRTQPLGELANGCDSSVAVCIRQRRDNLDRIGFALRQPAMFLAKTRG